MVFRVLFCLFLVSQSVFAQSTVSPDETSDEQEEVAQSAQPTPVEPIPAISPGISTSSPQQKNEEGAESSVEKKTSLQVQAGASKKKSKKKSRRPKKEVVPEPTPEPAPSPAPLINQAADYLQGSQEGISDRVIILANEVDKLFGSTRALDEYYESSLHVYQKSYLNTKGSGSYDIQTNLNLSLPNWKDTEKAFQRWWSGDTDTEERVTKEKFKELNPWDFTQGLNLRFSRPVAYGVLGRASKNFLTGNIVNHFYEQASWDSDRLWEEVTSLTSDFALNKRVLLRFINEADWGISNRTFNSYHGPSVVYTINKISLTSFDLRLITGVEDNLFYTENYTAGITYRTALHPLDWMFVQITPELSWPKPEHFTATWTIYLSLEIVFGSVK